MKSLILNPGQHAMETLYASNNIWTSVVINFKALIQSAQNSLPGTRLIERISRKFL